MQLNELGTIYFLGIGGIGMSNLARYFHKRGVRIHGYDKTATALTDELQREGMSIHFEDQPDLIPLTTDLVILTPAIPKELKEYQWVLHKNWPVHKRSEVLGWITSQVFNIAVAGTHGKTTTSALLAHLLVDAELPVTAFLGGICTNYGLNYLDKGDQIMVEEADEYDRSFLQLSPDIASIGSLDADHLDIYGSLEAMQLTYLDFAKRIKPNGRLLLSDTIDIEMIELFKRELIGVDVQCFGFQNEEIKASIIGTQSGWMVFEYISKIYHIKDLSLRLPGQHNVRNAMAAISVALQLGLREDQIRKGLLNFQGIQRRFQWRLETNAKVLIDDYAHHPEELRSVIQACRDIYPGRRITGIFQPHLYSRTRDFMSAFAYALEALDQIILVEIYPAREEPIPGITSERLFETINHPLKWICRKETLLELVSRLELDVVMTLGAGDLDLMIEDLIKVIARN
ncbi:MAG: UDP-N-acetylmuramate--L-alanine ligase [Saprospiraceae bacterium]|nr:UDP-N-acetylmuramate--L-alanine ligase [Saprospiraceae bacterium]